LPQSGDEAEVTRPSGASYPLDVRVQWLTPGPGRSALNEMLSGIQVLEIDHLATAAAEGAPFHIGALRTLGSRPAWDLVPRTDDDPATYRLAKAQEDRRHQGPRADLLLALELAVRCALTPFKTIAVPPAWVPRARQAHSKLLAALDGADPFEPIL
jgi:hypothetical protein